MYVMGNMVLTLGSVYSIIASENIDWPAVLPVRTADCFPAAIWRGVRVVVRCDTGNVV